MLHSLPAPCHGHPVSDTAVCILVAGRSEYAVIARQSVMSVLDHSGFDVFVGHTIAVGGLPRSGRVRRLPMTAPTRSHRAYRFLQKFELLDRVMAEHVGEFLIMLDADAVLGRELADADLDSALGERGLGMTEQTGIIRSIMARPDFLRHYAQHSLAFIQPQAKPPPLDQFRFYNSGVVVARRSELSGLVAWALTHIAAVDRDHQVGEHMIADQDYFQVWANTLRPGSCVELPWNWNHCELWDEDFPRDEFRIAHFSNFCDGPSGDTAARMAQLRRRGLRWPWLRRSLERWR
jgi:hypothetical protein